MKGRALFLTGYGFRIEKKLQFMDFEVDEIGPLDVLIEVHAAALNPVDYKTVYGMALIVMNPTLPVAMGYDLSGVVIAVGNKVESLHVGDAVYSKVPKAQMGSISTHCVVRADMVAIKPSNISFNDAAGLPLVSCTVLEAFEVAGITQNSRVFLQAGSGGIGTLAIQYAKHLGAFVYATTSTSNVEKIKELGADVVIDYKKVDYRKVVKEVDVVFDNVGGKYTRQALKVVRRGGKIISIAGHHDDATLASIGVARIFRLAFLVKGFFLLMRMRWKNVFYKHVWSFPNAKILQEVTTLIESGTIKPITDKIFPFEKAVDAFLYLKTNRAKGKVIIEVKNTEKRQSS